MNLALVCGDTNTWKHVSVCIIDQWGGLGTTQVDTSAVSDLKQMAPTNQVKLQRSKVLVRATNDTR